jgi:hypothetical protein
MVGKVLGVPHSPARKPENGSGQRFKSSHSARKKVRCAPLSKIFPLVDLPSLLERGKGGEAWRGRKRVRLGEGPGVRPRSGLSTHVPNAKYLHTLKLRVHNNAIAVRGTGPGFMPEGSPDPERVTQQYPRVKDLTRPEKSLPVDIGNGRSL